jgi:hypothetical protein
MKKAIKETPKERSSSDKKIQGHSHLKKAAIRKQVYNTEGEKTYEKSDTAKNNKRNTSGPKS